MVSIRDELIGKRFPVLDHGSIRLIDYMGSDADICRAARISTAGGSAPSTPNPERDRTLIRYLMRHHHSSPFEQCSVKLLIEAPIYIWRQIERHRSGRITEQQCQWDEPSVNERSQRYTEAIDAMQATPPDGWRKQSGDNRQGSGGTVTDWPEGWEGSDLTDFTGWPGPGYYLSGIEQKIRKLARGSYEERLRFGVAREQARKDLPLSTYTAAYVTFDLRNLLHFLGLRLAEDAQAEVRAVARVIADEIVAPLFPLAWGAFCEYQLAAMTLSRTEVEAVRTTLRGGWASLVVRLEDLFPNRRERSECMEKLRRLGLVPGEAVL